MAELFTFGSFAVIAPNMAIVLAARATALLLAVATLPASSKPVALGTYDDLVWDKYLVIFYHTCACSRRMGKCACSRRMGKTHSS